MKHLGQTKERNTVLTKGFGIVMTNSLKTGPCLSREGVGGWRGGRGGGGVREACNKFTFR